MRSRYITTMVPHQISLFTSSDTYYGDLPATVTDSSTGSPFSSGIWNFGDGNWNVYNCNATVPYTYQYIGQFVVNLTVVNSYGNSTNQKVVTAL